MPRSPLLRCPSEYSYYFLSLLLPFLSHVARQSMACAATFPPASFTSFLCTYSASMLFFSLVFRPSSFAEQEKVLLPFLLLAFTLTFFLSVLAGGNEILFTVAWATHAVPSSLFWPLSFHYVHKVFLPDLPQKRSTRMVHRFHLALWSLQGNVGDMVGCLYGTAFSPSLSASYLVPTSLFVGSVLVCFLLVARSKREPSPLSAPLSAPLSSLPFSRQLEQANPSEPIEEERDAWTAFLFVLSLVLLLLSDTSLKSASYFASNYLPDEKETGSYLSYNIASICGTIVSGVFFSLDVAYASVPFSSAILVSLLGDAKRGYAPVFIGFLVSFSSTTLSICICSDLSSRMGRVWKGEGAQGRATALLDGIGSLVASFVQLVPLRFFFSLQWVCASLLFASSLLLLVTTSLLEKREKARRRERVRRLTLPLVAPPQRRDDVVVDGTVCEGQSPPRLQGRETDPSSGLCGSAS